MRCQMFNADIKSLTSLLWGLIIPPPKLNANIFPLPFLDLSTTVSSGIRTTANPTQPPTRQPATAEATSPPAETTRSPIEIDLVNGNGDVDLTNGVTNNDASTEVDLTTTDETTTEAGGEVDDLFEGYEDEGDLFEGYDSYDYDPTVYDDVGSEGNGRDLDIRTGGEVLVDTNTGIPTYGSQENADLVTEPQIDLRALGFGDAPIEDDYSDDTNPRKGKAPLVLGSFEPATLEVNAPFFDEYSELESEAQELDDDEDVKFISVPLMIEELRGGIDGVRGGDPTVILAGSPPEDEEENYEDSDYFGGSSSSEEPSNAVTVTPEPAVTVRGFVRGRLGGFITGRSRSRPNPVGRGAKEAAGDDAERPRVGSKRVEDIPKEAFHSFLVEPPQGGGSSENSSNQKKRGVDWSQRLREKRRKRIWKQFRLN